MTQARSPSSVNHAGNHDNALSSDSVDTGMSSSSRPGMSHPVDHGFFNRHTTAIRPLSWIVCLSMQPNRSIR